jgi:hypothetical protein
MRRRQFTNATLAATGAWLAPVALAAKVSDADAASGIRAALERGAGAAVDLLGRPDGFLGNPKVKIPLPRVMKDVAKIAKLTGQQKQVDDLVTAMNRAAEAAVPEARALLVSAVKSMSVQDAQRIVSGGDDSVTKFFASKTRQPLAEKFLPIVTRETRKVDLASQYNALAGKAAGIGLVKGDEANVERYVTGKALDGLYFMIGEEEKKIRRDPIGTGSAILAKVFGK